MQTIPNVATADGYTNALTLGPDASCQQIAYVVANAAAYAEVAAADRAGTQQPWGPELLITPQSNTITRCQGIRFRSAVPGVPARVVAQLITPGDPVPGAGTPFTAVLSSAGGVSPVGTITRVTALPLAPVDLQQVMLDLSALGAAYAGYEWLCTYNASTAYWDVVGVPIVVAAAGGGVGAGAWTELASIAVPNQGDYLTEVVGAEWDSAAGNQIFYTGVSIGGAAPSVGVTPRTESYTSGAVGAQPGTGTRLSGVPAGGRVSAMFFTAPAASSVVGITLKATPVRIK